MSWLDKRLTGQPGPPGPPGVTTLTNDVKLLSGTDATVQGIQNVPVAATAPPSVGSSIQQFDGTQYAPTGAPTKVIYGQNATFTTIGAATDDAPAIQAYVNANPACGVLRIVNCVLKSKIDFSPWTGQYNKLETQGVNRLAMNAAEIDMVMTMTVEGVGGGSTSGVNASQGPQSLLLCYNSSNSSTQEPNNLVTNAYTDGAYVNVYQFNTFQAQLADSLIGGTMTTTSITDPTWSGTFTAIAANGPIVYLVPSGGTSPSGVTTASDVHWSIGSGPSLRSGTNGDNTGRGPLKALAVRNLKNLTGQSWKHWLALYTTSNSFLTQKVHRILGIGGPTVAYINAELEQFYNLLTLPEYGSTGTNPGNANLTAYEAYDVIRAVGNCTVRNLSILYAQGPGICVDGAMGVGNQKFAVVENCSVNGSGTFVPAPAHVPLIVDDMFFFDVRNMSLGTTTGNQSANMLFTSTSGLGGEYVGLGTVSNVSMFYYGAVLWSEGALQAPVEIDFIDTGTDGTHSYAGQSWFALFTVAYAASNITATNCYIADSSGTVYLLESLLPGANLFGFTANNCSGYIGPNIGSTMAGTNFQRGPGGPLQEVNAAQWSAESMGMTDSQEIGNGDDFSPVITLPFQIQMPSLGTPEEWLSITTGTLSYSTLSSDGYPLRGPDGSSGQMMRVSGSGAGNYATVASTTVMPVVGDVVLVFCRAQTTDPTHGLGFVGSNGSGLFAPSNVFFNGRGDNSCPLFYGNVVDNLLGGQWFDVVLYAKITKLTSSAVSTVSLRISGNSFGDLVIDPESVAMMYVPAGAHPTLQPAEVVRYYRKPRRQVTNATPGDVAVPSRVWMSFGPSLYSGSRFGTKRLQTFNTVATPAFSVSVLNKQAVTYLVEWSAVTPSQIGSGYVSGGAFKFTGFANASGAITVQAIDTLGNNYNCGASGAAAATPVTFTTSTNTITVNANANVTAKTIWQFTVTPTNAMDMGEFDPSITSAAGTVHGSWNGIGAAGGDAITIMGTGFVAGPSLAFSANGVPCTSVAFVNSTTCTAVAPAQTGVASPSSTFTLSGVNGDGTVLASSTITYQWDPSQLPSLAAWFQVTQSNDAYTTVASGKVTSLAARAGSAIGPLTDSTSGNQPTYTASAIGTRPALDNTAAVATCNLNNAGFTAIPQPYTISFVGQSSSLPPVGGNTQQNICGDNGVHMEIDVWAQPAASPNLVLDLLGGAGADVTITAATFGTWTSAFSLDVVFNGASSQAYHNGTTLGGAVNLGSASFADLTVMNQKPSTTNGWKGYGASWVITSNAVDATHLGYLSTWRQAYYGVPG